MKKFLQLSILLPIILGGLLLNIQIVKAVSCGGSCFISCPSGYVSSGSAGCESGANGANTCCVASTGETITILGGSVDTGSLNGFLQLAINISKWILGISGSATLLMFVYGGLKMLLSEGSSDKVTEAKSIITGAVIGLLIIFASYTIIGFALFTMGISKKDTGWASSGWWPKNE